MRVFGSLLNDAAHGGDIDLHIQVQGKLDKPVWQAALLAAQLQRQLDGRKVDVRLLDGYLAVLPIDEIALSEGELLI